MRTRYSHDQQTLADVFAGFFANESPPEVVRAAAANGTGFDPVLWSQLAELGAPGMAAPESHDGGGATLVDLAVVIWEWGRRLAPVPLVEHAVATRLIIAATSAPNNDHSDTTPTAAPTPNNNHSNTAHTKPTAIPTPDNNHFDTAAASDRDNDHSSAAHTNPTAAPTPEAAHTKPTAPPTPDTAPTNPTATTADVLSGDLIADLIAGERIATLALRPLDTRCHARLVPAGAIADVVVALDSGALIVSESDSQAVSESRLPSVVSPNTADLPLADRDLSKASVALLPGARCRRVWEQALTEWKSLMAIAYCGLASEALDLGVAYVTQRHQFGVPVGSFQAVQHGLADAATRAEGARLLAWRAVCAVQQQQPKTHRLASMALLFAAESARFATDRVLQYHGGYGYSEEYDIQLYYRRAAGWLLQLGEPAAELSRLANDRFGPPNQSTK